MTQRYQRDDLPGIVCWLTRMIAPSVLDIVTPDNQLVGDLGFHSLAQVELTLVIEDIFSVEEIEMELTAKIERVADIVSLVGDALDSGKATMPTPAYVAELAAEYGMSPGAGP